MSSTIQNKISSLIQTQFPEFIQNDHVQFVQFLKYYYQFLESGKLTIEGVNSFIKIETNTLNYVLDQNDEKIVLEESTIKFKIGETIVGQTSGAQAKVLVDDFDRNSCIFISAQQLFIPGETVVGQTSGAKSAVISYQANPVQNIQQFLDYVDADYTVTNFLDKFRDAFMTSLPSTLASGISRRNLIKNIKDLYAAKGTTDGHKLFFRILFDEEATILYPRDNILRASDGVWSTDKILRVVELGNSNFTNLIGQRIYTLDSAERIVSSAVVVTVVKFREGSNLIAELSLDVDSIDGTFNVGDFVYGIDSVLDIQIRAEIQSIVTGSNITDAGFNYKVDDRIIFGSGGNNAAVAKIDSVGSGSIDEIMIESGGSGYEIGDKLSFDTTDTEGVGTVAKVSVVGGSFLLEDATDPFHMVTEDEDNIITEDNLYLQLETNLDSDSYLIKENLDTIIIEPGTFSEAVDDTSWHDEVGEITRIKIINGGYGYTSLPTVYFDLEVSQTNPTPTNGTGANLFALSTRTPGIGHAQGIAITNFGLQYTSSPPISFITNLIVKNVTGSFSAGDDLVSHPGTVTNYDASRRLLRLNTSGNFKKGDIVQGIAGQAEVHFNGTGTAESIVGTIGTTVGNFVNERGKVSNDAMRLQDSYYYQDFSYVARLGQSINEWRYSHRKAVHPAGWNVFGEVSFSTLLLARPTVMQSTAVDGIPLLDFEMFFSKVFGRRLGTKTDGTEKSQNSNADKQDPDNLLPGERDVTLTNETFVRLNTNRGSHRNGSTLGDLVRYAFAVPPLLTNEIAYDYFDPGGRRITTSYNQNTLAEADALFANITKDLFPINQFKQYTIKAVSDYFFLKLDDGLGNKGGKILLEDYTDAYQFITEDRLENIITEDGFNLIGEEASGGFLQTEELGTPENAFKVKLNIPPPSEIRVYKPYDWNVFGNVSFSTVLRLRPTIIQTIIDETATVVDVLNVEVDYSTRLNVGANTIVQVSTTLKLSDNAGALWKGSSLANLPKYAFVKSPASADEVTLYSIYQFKDRTIKSVSDYFFLKLTDDDKIVLEDSGGYLQSEQLGIPDEAFNVKVNVPPRAEIVTT